MNADFWTLITGVLIANILSAWFVWGMVMASRVFDKEPIRFEMVTALLVPLCMAGVGLYFYG